MHRRRFKLVRMNEVVINGRFLGRRPTGVDRYAIEVIRALDDLLQQDDPDLRRFTFEILAPAGTLAPEGLKNIRFRCAGIGSGYAWEQLELPRALHGRWLLNLCNTAPMIVQRQTVVVHDAATARLTDAFSPMFRRVYGLMMPTIGRRACSPITISDFSRTELSQCWGIDTHGSPLASGSGEHILRVEPDPDALDRYRLRPHAYVLAVGSAAPHKNFARLAAAAGVLEGTGIDLAVVGASIPRVFGTAELALSPAVRQIGYVDDRALRALYDNALAFAFPSIYEGFGLPPLEAMHCGCPVIASSAASLPEVCGPAALYFDPLDAHSIEVALLRIATRPAERAALIEAGHQRTNRFRWSDCARAIVASIGRPDQRGSNRASPRRADGAVSREHVR